MVGSSTEIVKRSIPFIIFFLAAFLALEILSHIPVWFWVLLIALFIVSVWAWVVKS
jgi:hypothetical protein